MKKNFFTSLAITMLLLIPNSKAAFEAEQFFSCEALKMPVRIIFKTAYGQLIHDVSTDDKSIQALKKDTDIPEKLYLQSSHNTIQTEGYVKLTSALTEYITDDKICVIPEEIEVFIGYRDPVIYIAKEYRSRPCEFSVMLRHQQIHQQINIYALQYILPLMKEAIIQATQNITPAMATDKSQIKTRIQNLQNEYIAAIRPILDAFNDLREEENHKFDKITNYKIDEKLCRSYNERRAKARQSQKTKN